MPRKILMALDGSEISSKFNLTTVLHPDYKIRKAQRSLVFSKRVKRDSVMTVCQVDLPGCQRE